LCPRASKWTSGIKVIKFPMCNESAVGSTPQYAVNFPDSKACSNPLSLCKYQKQLFFSLELCGIADETSRPQFDHHGWFPLVHGDGSTRIVFGFRQVTTWRDRSFAVPPPGTLQPTLATTSSEPHANSAIEGGHASVAKFRSSTTIFASVHGLALFKIDRSPQIWPRRPRTPVLHDGNPRSKALRAQCCGRVA